MRKQRIATCLWGGIIGCLTGFAAVACLLTAFDLYAAVPETLLLYCLATAALWAVCSRGKWSLLPLGLSAVLLGYFWQSGLLEDCIESLLYRLSKLYSVAYKWEVVNWSGRDAEEMEETLGPCLYMLGCLVTAVVTWTVCRRKSSIPAVVMAILPLVPTMLVTDRVPASVWLFCLLLGIGLLLLTGSVRRTDEGQGNRLTLLLMLPLVLALGLLFGLSPKDEYDGEKTAEKYANTMFSTIQHQFMVMTGQTETLITEANAEKVDLASVGSRTASRNEVLRVTSTDYTGTVYLRGRSLDWYDGVSWTNKGQGAELFWPRTDRLTHAGEMMISTRYAHRMLYLPYYTTSMSLEGVETGIINDKELTFYSIACGVVPAGQSLKGIYDPTLVTDECTQLPPEVEKWAKDLAKQIVGDLEDPYLKAQAIANYVRESAEYDLETGRMPSGRTDFAKWFLEASDTGYCVHFATAATVLLKAAGVPARYVTGYAARVTQGKTTVVRTADAHAWAEYWIPGFGWVVLEATPADTSASDNADDPVVPPVDETPEPEPDDPVDPDDPEDPDDDQTQDPDDPDDQPDDPQNQDPNQSVSNVGGADGPGTVEGPDLGWLLWVALGLLTAAAIPLQWRLRVWLRLRRLGKGTVNQRILAKWNYLCLLWKKTKQPQDETLLELAQKAKFGPDTLEAAKLLPFDKAIRAQRTQLQSRNFFLQLYYTLILAIY